MARIKGWKKTGRNRWSNGIFNVTIGKVREGYQVNTPDGSFIPTTQYDAYKNAVRYMKANPELHLKRRY